MLPQKCDLDQLIDGNRAMWAQSCSPPTVCWPAHPSPRIFAWPAAVYFSANSAQSCGKGRNDLMSGRRTWCEHPAPEDPNPSDGKWTARR